jgi:hypothetical protein
MPEIRVYYPSHPTRHYWCPALEDMTLEETIKDIGGDAPKVVGWLGFHGMHPNTIELAHAWACMIDEYGEAFVGFVKTMGEDHWEKFDEDNVQVVHPDTVSSDCGGLSAKGVYAWEYFEEQYGKVPSWLIHNADWEDAASELLDGQSTYDGDDGNLYIYREA